MSSNQSTEAKGGWNDSEFTPDEAGFATASQYNWGTNDSDFFSSVIKSNKVVHLYQLFTLSPLFLYLLFDLYKKLLVIFA